MSIHSMVIEKFGLSVRSTVIEKWGMSVRSNPKFGCAFSHVRGRSMQIKINKQLKSCYIIYLCSGKAFGGVKFLLPKE